jgi:glycosyltransferase involved in cell wall biosynthesis
MKILSWMKKENSGLARTTLELAKYYELHDPKVDVCIKEPTGEGSLFGYCKEDMSDIDMHTIHSQLGATTYYDNKPKIMWMHGEPQSSVGNGVSMKAICDLAPRVDAFIAMREAEMSIWSSIKRTYLVPKGIDLEYYFPIAGSEKLSGEPAVLYCENWRGQRNPLYLCVAMQKVWQKFPKARLHLYNVQDKRMKETFDALIKNNKWWTFIRSIQGPVPITEINALYNKVDIVVSCLFPLYARSIEAFGAGKAFISPGYKEHDYEYQCDLDPDSIADTIIRCWENYGKVDYRAYAEKHHDVRNTVKEAVGVYNRYL